MYYVGSYKMKFLSYQRAYISETIIHIKKLESYGTSAKFAYSYNILYQSNITCFNLLTPTWAIAADAIQFIW